MATASKPRYVDTSNSALAIDCPKCGLVTPRFLQFCRNCGYQLWPSGPVASAAFRAWRDADSQRRTARRFDLTIPGQEPEDEYFDYEARAHALGIHLFPASNWPFVICVGMLFLFLAAVPFPTPARIALGVIGVASFLTGIIGWVIIEDTRMYPADTDLAATGSGGAHPIHEDLTTHGDH